MSTDTSGRTRAARPTEKRFTRKDEREVREKLRRLKLLTAELEAKAGLRRSQGRRQLVAIAADLLPKAAGFARKGRPRLLAIVARIIGDEKLRARIPKLDE